MKKRGRLERSPVMVFRSTRAWSSQTKPVESTPHHAATATARRAGNAQRSGFGEGSLTDCR